MPIVTIAATQTRVTGYQGDGGPLWLALFAQKDYFTGSGESVVSGDPQFNNNFYRKVPLTIIDGEGLVSIPEIVIESTEDADPQATLTAYFLDSRLQLIRPFHRTFRVPPSPASTTWKLLMENLTVPQIVIDPAISRTEGALQEWNAAHGLVDSIIRRIGAALAIVGGLTISGAAAVAGLLSAGSAAISGNASVGNDATVTRDVTAGRDVVATRNVIGANLFGNIDGTTGGTSDSLTGNKWHGDGSLMIQVDDDDDHDGELVVRVGDDATGIDALKVHTDATVEVTDVLSGYIRDKGGRCIDVKAPPYNARGNDDDDDTAAIEAARAAMYAGDYLGTLFFPPGRYKTSGGHELIGGITVEGAGGAQPGLAFGLTNTEMSVLRLTAENTTVFQIMPRAVAVKVHDLSGVADSDEGTQFIYAEGNNPTGMEAPSSSFGHLFQRLWTDGFRAGIEVQTTDPAKTWQFDRVGVKNCAFVGGPYGIFLDSPDCDQWSVEGCQLGLGVGMSYGAYCQRVGTISFANCYGVQNPGTPGRSLFFFTPQRAMIHILNCWTEQSDFFMELQDSAITNRGSIIVLTANGITAMYLGHSAAILSQGNTYHSGAVTVGPNTGDGAIHSIADSVIIGASAPTVVLDESPFNLNVPGLGHPANNTLTEIGLRRNIIDARGSSGGFRVRGNMGLNNTAPGAGLTGDSFEMSGAQDNYVNLIMSRAGAPSWASRRWRLAVGQDGSLFLEDVGHGTRAYIDPAGALHLKGPIIYDL